MDTKVSGDVTVDEFKRMTGKTRIQKADFEQISTVFKLKKVKGRTSQ